MVVKGSAWSAPNLFWLDLAGLSDRVFRRGRHLASAVPRPFLDSPSWCGAYGTRCIQCETRS